MIAVISGLFESASSPANGLTDLAERLHDAHPGELVQRFAWSEWGDVIPFLQAQTTILIGHSFGGCTSVMRSRQLEPINRDVHLILIDPVRHRANDRSFDVPFSDDPLAQVFGRPFMAGPNWLSAKCYLRTLATWLPPFHQGIDVGSANGLVNIQIPDTDHVSIIKAVTLDIMRDVQQIFDSTPIPVMSI